MNTKQFIHEKNLIMSEIPDYLKEASKNVYPTKEMTHTGDGVYNLIQDAKRDGFIAGATSPESARYHQSAVEKGDFNAECYRTACQNRPAVFYNHSTRKYYCPSCAKLINDVNRADAMRLYGHELCTIGYPATPQPVSLEWVKASERLGEFEDSDIPHWKFWHPQFCKIDGQPATRPFFRKDTVTGETVFSYIYFGEFDKEIEEKEFHRIEWLSESGEKGKELEEARKEIEKWKGLYELTDQQRKDWAEMCIKQKERIESLELQISVNNL